MNAKHTNTVLIVAAHPDDEVLGCGGTIARLAQEGHEVYIAILGEGATSRYQQRDQSDRTQIEALHNHSRHVAKLLSAKDLFLHDLPDNRFDTIPLLDIIKVIEELVSNLQPDVIYAHHGGDLNVDHSIIHRAVLTAARPFEGSPVKEIYTFEIPSSTEWAFQQFEPEFRPNIFVDITDTLEMKVQAMQVYESERRTYPHPRSPESLRNIAHRWGSMAGLKAAEAFQLIRSIR